MAVGDRPPPRAKYLAGLVEYERPRRVPPRDGASQRQRLLAAAISVFAAGGFHEAAVTEIADRAGVSIRTFYDLFEDKQVCFHAAFDAAVVRLSERLEPAAEQGDDWRSRLRSLLAELLCFVGSEPELARLLLIGSRSAPPAELRRRDEALGDLARRLAAQVGLGAGDDPSPNSALLSLGAVETVLYGRLQNRKAVEEAELLSSLMYFVLTPYLGHEVAVEELGGA